MNSYRLFTVLKSKKNTIIEKLNIDTLIKH